MPFASAASIDPDRTHLADVYRANLRLTLLVIGPVAVYFAIFAHPLLATWIDPHFAAQASSPLRFLGVAAVMLALSAAPADVARGLGSPRWVAAFTICAAVVAVGAAFALASAHGAGGVAAALALGLTVATVPFIALVAIRMLDVGLLKTARAFAGPVGALAALAALFWIAWAISASFAAAIVGGFLGAAAYALIVFKLVLADRERAALHQAWRQFPAMDRVREWLRSRRGTG
jgi:O-antigen/teichoic acid export membrane protein